MPAQKLNLPNGLTQKVNQFLVWQKTFEAAQNVLGTVEGRGTKVFVLAQKLNLLDSWF